VLLPFRHAVRAHVAEGAALCIALGASFNPQVPTLLSLPPCPLLPLAPFNFSLYGISQKIRELLAIIKNGV
jgi:hypothetical protein